MRIWIDLANSPHVLLFEPVVAHFEEAGHEVVLTVRDHAQTLGLARQKWSDLVVVGGESPAGRSKKGRAILSRADSLRRFARSRRPDVALSHGSYAQIVAAAAARVPAVTMMDYEYQPANHLSFRLAQRVIVPTAFPEEWLRRCGARPAKTLRYAAFKEELYLAGYVPDRTAIAELNLNTSDAIVVMRAPPDGALYHRDVNTRFEELLEEGRARSDVQTVVLSRTRAQQARYEQLEGTIVPSQPVDGRSLLAHADVVIGGGGTMSRESALLGTPTYTVFSGRLAAVDKALMDDGRLFDLRDPSVTPSFEKKTAQVAAIPSDRRDEILAAIDRALAAAVGRR